MPAANLVIPEAVAADLELNPEAAVVVAAGEGTGEPVGWLRLDLGEADPTGAALCREVAETVAAALSVDGRVVVTGARAAPREKLAEMRNHLWPVLHFSRVYRLRAGQPVERTDVAGTRLLHSAQPPATDGFVVVAMRGEHALSPAVTIEKFDGTAAGWNGDPGSPQYGHFRWMRRLLAVLARPRPDDEILDAGCGAGWVGLEAARRGGRLAAFDPSPAMIDFVEQNARELGVAVDARVGFMEAAPFSTRFDLVLNSGVISFAPDAAAYLAGLDRLVKPGGRLVIGDLNPLSRGFRRRRAERMVLPSRELNGLPRARVIDLLESRGYRIDWVRYYQNTYPIPELMHRSESHLRCWLLLQLNRVSSALDAALGSRSAGWFDSWIIGATKRHN